MLYINIKKKLDKMLGIKEGGKNASYKFVKGLMGSIVDIILELPLSKQELYSIHSESEFQNIIFSHLSVLLDELKKNFSNVSVRKEVKLTPENKIDLLITIDNIRIGIELKYDIEKNEGESKRMLEQVVEYIEHLDGLLVVSYNNIRQSKLKRIDEISKMKNKPISVVMFLAKWRG